MLARGSRLSVLYRWTLLLVAGWLAAPAVAGSLADFDKPADTGALREQVARLTQTLKREPRDVRALFARGEAYFKLREFDDAVDDFTRAIDIDPTFDDAWFGRGMARGRAGQISEAVQDLTVYLDRHPKSSLAYTKRGVRYLWRGAVDKAEADFERALAFDPNNAEAHDDLGVILAQRGEYAQAERHFTATLKADPSYQKGHHNLAMVYFITGRHEPALTAVNRALALSEQHRDALLLKGLILDALGRPAEAAHARDDAELAPAGGTSERMPIK
jgi:tetratricopeptide (TPR) repeat protein